MAEDAGRRLEAGEIAEFTAVGERAARAAGAFLMARFRDDFKITRKGEIDLVTEVDLAAERLIVSCLREAFPDHAILAEEMHAATKPGACTWIIDPLDGTTNYAHGYPVFAVSIGLEIDGAVEWGMVYNPNLEEAFIARRGGGAFLNGEPLRVSRTPALGASLLATGFPYDIRTSEENNLANFRHFAVRAQGIRRGGSAALDLCYVAAGRFDGFWELKLNPWDCSAGYLMVREAGGRVTNLRGDFGSIYDRECIASNVLIHEEMMAVLRAAQGAPGTA
jgi:myo-inositol-1(or 4)-monophosphatase